MSNIRDAVPENLAHWLDAHSVEGEADFGNPGFSELRQAWIGRVPEQVALPLLEDWLAEQSRCQNDAEIVFAQLFLIEPIERDQDGEIVVPAWVGMWWSQILTSQPWDQRLGEATAAARDYLAERGVELPATSVEEPVKSPTQEHAE